MIILPDSMTVAQLRDIEKDNPRMPQYVHRVTSRTYQAFLDTLYRELESIFSGLVTDANTLQGDGHTENSLNADICRQLRRAGYSAHFDKNNRGHSDITVEYGAYTWIGEGKKVHSVDNTHLRGGYDQLIHRYVPGTPNADQAGILIYCYAPDAKHVLSSWGAHLAQCNKSTPGYADNIYSCLRNPKFSFSSTANHNGSGTEIKIRHFILSLYWKPPP